MPLVLGQLSAIFVKNYRNLPEVVSTSQDVFNFRQYGKDTFLECEITSGTDRLARVIFSFKAYRCVVQAFAMFSGILATKSCNWQRGFFRSNLPRRCCNYSR